MFTWLCKISTRKFYIKKIHLTRHPLLWSTLKFLHVYFLYSFPLNWITFSWLASNFGLFKFSHKISSFMNCIHGHSQCLLFRNLQLWSFSHIKRVVQVKKYVNHVDFYILMVCSNMIPRQGIGYHITNSRSKSVVIKKVLINQDRTKQEHVKEAL